MEVDIPELPKIPTKFYGSSGLERTAHHEHCKKISNFRNSVKSIKMPGDIPPLSASQARGFAISRRQISGRVVNRLFPEQCLSTVVPFNVVSIDGYAGF